MSRRRRGAGALARPAEGVLQGSGRDRRGARRRRLVPHRRRRLHRRRRPPQDHRPRQGRRPASSAAPTTAPCSRPSTSRTSSSSFRTSRRRSPSATSARRSAPSSTSTSRRSATGPRSATCLTAATPTWRRSPRCSQLVRECVEKVNADLAADERLAGSQISRFLVLHKELDADDGELTRTRKVRRGFIAERYQVLVDALYGGKTRAVRRDRGEVRGRPHRQGRGDAEDRRRADLRAGRAGGVMASARRPATSSSTCTTSACASAASRR